MNKITEKLSKFFTEKQIQAMKDAWKYGQWGDCEITFYGSFDEAYAYGACTNDIKKGGHFTGRQVSGILGGISKNIKNKNCNLVENIPDWWGDGSGDMIFFNVHAFGFNDKDNAWDEFNKWSNE